MMRLKFVSLVLVVCVFLISACTPNNLKASPAQSMAVQSTEEYVNPYPVPESVTGSDDSNDPVNQATTNEAYPAPADYKDLPAVLYYPENFITGLEIPSPTTGMAVITGQLMNAVETNKPYISAVFLAPVEASNAPDQSPKINFNRRSNPMGVQDVENGRFVFSDVIPGQYAIVIWSPGESFFIKDSTGNTFILEGKAGEVSDLGVILFE